jgi:creatinine amidohydrolase
MFTLEEMTRPELERAIASGVTTVVIPFGSVEDQGGHLPLGSDTLLADAVGREVAERLDAVLAPTVHVGHADQHVQGAGTLTVPAGTLRDIAIHTARSLIAHGFRLIVLLSTHGGNHDALGQALESLSAEFPDVVVCTPRGEVGPDPGSHSGKWLTSVMMVLRPELVDAGSADAALAAEVSAATPVRGRENLERFVSAIVQRVRDAAGERDRG